MLSLASRALAGAALSACLQIASAAALPPASHAYGLNKTYADELGGPPLTPHGGTLGKTAYQFGKGQGATLQGVVARETYSLELQFTPTETSGYRRIVDFDAGDSELGLYIHYGYAYFYNLAGGNDLVFSDGKPAHVVITRNGKNKRVSVYVGGALQFQFTDSNNAAVFSDTPAGSLATLLMDDGDYAGEHTAGSLDHVRVFDTVLTAQHAKALSQGKLPPNVKTR